MRLRTEARTGSHTLVYQYDGANRLTRTIVQYWDGREHVGETCEYDADGRTTKNLHLDPVFIPPDAPFAWSAGGDGGGSDAVRVLDGDGRLLWRVDFLYDDARNVIEEALTRTDEMLPQELVAQASRRSWPRFARSLAWTNPHASGIVTMRPGEESRSSGSLAGPGSDERKTMAYNDHGDLDRVCF